MKFINTEKLVSKLVKEDVLEKELDKKIGAEENFTHFLCEGKLNPTIEEVKKIVNALDLNAQETYEIFFDI